MAPGRFQRQEACAAELYRPHSFADSLQARRAREGEIAGPLGQEKIRRRGLFGEAPVCRAEILRRAVMVKIPTAKDLQAKIAMVESEKASVAMKAHAAADAEKQAFVNRITKPSGPTDEQVIEKAT